MKVARKNPIGVFDSGVGGLTVYKALREVLPHEDFIYLGDTARLPYGTKGPDTVAQYTLQAAHHLMEDSIKLLVVACNTASALALPSLRTMLPELPCVGVIEAGAAAAVSASVLGRIAVLATESTVQSGAYLKALKRQRPDVDVTMLSANLLVGLAEEGWCEGVEAEAVVGRYVRALKPGFDSLVLGCTHFPLLAPILRKAVGEKVAVIDSAAMTAKMVAEYLKTEGLLNPSEKLGQTRFMVTDQPERFTALAKRFLGMDTVLDVGLAYLLPDFGGQIDTGIKVQAL